MTPPPLRDIFAVIRTALREDAASRDLTSRAVIPASTRLRARVIAKTPGVLAGGPIAAWTFHAFDPSLRCALKRPDGSRLARGRLILTVEGSARSIFAAERTALNFLGHLSGIATLTRRFVRSVQGTRARILDTRKTLPGLRLLEKYAVRVGGGHSHRGNLSEAILIKTNHLKALRQGQRTAYSVQRIKQIQQAIDRAKLIRPKRVVQIEVVNLKELDAALQARPDVILLDNWPRSQLRHAVQVLNAARSTLNAKPLLEVSGGVTLANVRAIAKAGVDRISIGRLTHSAPSLDVSLVVT